MWPMDSYVLFWDWLLSPLSLTWTYANKKTSSMGQGDTLHFLWMQKRNGTKESDGRNAFAIGLKTQKTFTKNLAHLGRDLPF